MQARINKLLVVVHVGSEAQAKRNVAIALENGADGVFLIDHRGSTDVDEIIGIYRSVRSQYANSFLGLNLLGHHNDTGIVRAASLNVMALWSDDAGLVETVHGTVDSRPAELTHEHRQKLGWKGLYFGGVAFKYRPQVQQLSNVALAAVPFVDVITTSGDATGVPPSLEKICTMRDAIGDHPLAVASGITPENVEQYLPYVDYFLVSTGISSSFWDLSPVRVRELASLMHRG